MTALGKVIATVGVLDFDIARDFYGSKLGLELVDDLPFALVSSEHGAMVRLAKVEAVVAAPYTLIGWTVDDIATSVADLTGRGVEFVRYPYFQQDAAGIWTAPSGDRVAWMLDPFGNNLSITQFSTEP